MGRNVVVLALAAAFSLGAALAPAEPGHALFIPKKWKKAATKAVNTAVNTVVEVAPVVAKETWSFSTNCAKDPKACEKDVKEFASQVTREATEWAEEEIGDLIAAVEDGWNSLTGAMGDAVLNAAVDGILFVVNPFVECVTFGQNSIPGALRGTELGDRLASTLRRRAPQSCAWKTDMDLGLLKIAGFNVGNFLSDQVKGGLKLGVALAASKIQNAWRNLQATATYVNWKKTGKPYDVPPATPKVTTLASSVKLVTKELIKNVAKNIAVDLAIQAAIFPLGYLVAAGACIVTPNSTCYKTQFLEYSKNWLFDTISGVALSAIDAVAIKPLVVYLGTTVTAGVAAVIAATTAGAGLLAAPVIGSIVALVANVVITMVLQCVTKAYFFKLYEDTTWKASCSFFESLVSTDTLDTFTMNRTNNTTVCQ